MEDIEKLNQADESLKDGVRAYLNAGWSHAEIVNRFEDILDEEQMDSTPHISGGPKKLT